MTDTKSNLPHILAEHRKWLDGDGGSRANLLGADLSDANLLGADLSGANLSGANLLGAEHLIDGGQRADGYRFVGWVKDGVLMIRAGCRNLTVAEYRTHNANRGNVALRGETTAILDHIERVAIIRALTEAKS